jgi:hypothetical protein
VENTGQKQKQNKITLVSNGVDSAIDEAQSALVCQVRESIVPLIHAYIADFNKEASCIFIADLEKFCPIVQDLKKLEQELIEATVDRVVDFTNHQREEIWKQKKNVSSV